MYFFSQNTETVLSLVYALLIIPVTCVQAKLFLFCVAQGWIPPWFSKFFNMNPIVWGRRRDPRPVNKMEYVPPDGCLTEVPLNCDDFPAGWYDLTFWSIFYLNYMSFMVYCIVDLSTILTNTYLLPPGYIAPEKTSFLITSCYAIPIILLSWRSVVKKLWSSVERQFAQNYRLLPANPEMATLQITLGEMENPVEAARLHGEGMNEFMARPHNVRAGQPSLFSWLALIGLLPVVEGHTLSPSLSTSTFHAFGILIFILVFVAGESRPLGTSYFRRFLVLLTSGYLVVEGAIPARIFEQPDLPKNGNNFFLFALVSTFSLCIGTFIVPLIRAIGRKTRRAIQRILFTDERRDKVRKFCEDVLKDVRNEMQAESGDFELPISYLELAKFWAHKKLDSLSVFFDNLFMKATTVICLYIAIRISHPEWRWLRLLAVLGAFREKVYIERYLKTPYFDRMMREMQVEKLLDEDRLYNESLPDLDEVVEEEERIFEAQNCERIAKYSSGETELMSTSSERSETASIASSVLHRDEDMEIEIKVPYKAVLGPDTQAFASQLEAFLTPTFPKLILTYIGSIFLAPRYSDGPKRCIAHHSVALAGLMTGIYQLRGQAVLTVIDMFFGNRAGFTGESDSGEATATGEDWIADIASEFENISKVETSKFGELMTSFFTFVTTLPVIFSKAYTVDSYKDIWQLVCSGIKVGGASMSTLLRGVITIQNNVSGLDSVPGAKGLIKKLLVGDSLDLEVIKCRELLKKLKSATLDIKSSEAEATILRFKKLAVRCRRQVIKSKASAFEVQRAEKADDMLNEIVIWFSTRGAKPRAYCQAFHSSDAGIGKSVFCTTLSSLMHTWMGKEEIKRVDPYVLCKNFQDVTNATTEVLLDDEGQIKADKRTEPFAGAVFKLAEPRYVPCEKADVNDKGKHFYCHDIVTYIDNTVDRGMKAEVYCAAAAIRRLGDACEIRIKPQYKNPLGGMKEGLHLDPYGSHLEFRPFTLRKDGTDLKPAPAPTKKKGKGKTNRSPDEKKQPTVDFIEDNVYAENGGWIDNVKFLTWKRERFLSHRQFQSELISRLANASCEKLCERCGVLPMGSCGCGQDFMDADDGGSEYSEVTLEQEAESLSETLYGLLPLQPRDPGGRGQIDRLVFHFSSILSFQTHVSGFLGDMVTWLFWKQSADPIFFILTLWLLYENIILAEFSITITLFTITWLVIWGAYRKVRKAVLWMRQFPPRQLVSMYNGNMRNMEGVAAYAVPDLSYYKYAVAGIIALGAIAASNRYIVPILTSLFESDDEVTVNKQSAGDEKEIFDKLAPELKKLGKKRIVIEMDAEGCAVETVVSEIPVPAETQPHQISPILQEEPKTPENPILHESLDFTKAEGCGHRDLKKQWEAHEKILSKADVQATTIVPEDLIRKLKRNCFRVRITTKDTTCHQYIFMIDSRVGYTASHGVTDKNCQLSTITVTSIDPSKVFSFTLSYPSVVMHQHRDIAALCLPEKVFGYLPTLYNYLPKTLSKGMTTLHRLVGVDGKIESEKVFGIDEPAVFRCNKQREISKIDENGKLRTIRVEPKIRNDWSYLIPRTAKSSVAGDCGLPAISHSSPRVIVGIHAGGNTTKDAEIDFDGIKTYNGVTLLPITQEDNDKFLEFFQKNTPYIRKLAKFEPLELMSWKADRTVSDTLPPSKHPVFFIPADGEQRNIQVVGSRPSNFTPITCMKINKNLAEAVQFLGVQPIVSPPRFNWKESVRAVIKVSAEVHPQGDPDDVALAGRLFLDHVTPTVGKFKEKFPEMTNSMTIHEVLNGKGPIPSMKLGTASGVGGSKRDHVIGEVPERYLGPEMAWDIGAVKKMLSEGVDPRLVIEGCLKDEALKDGKLERFFMVTPMPLHITTTQFLRVLLEISNQFPNDHCTAIGQNRVGPEWMESIEPFFQDEFRDYCFATDFADFDKTDHCLLREETMKSYASEAKILGYSEDELKMLSGVMKTLLEPELNLSGVVIILNLLWISGTIATAHANGRRQFFLMLIDYIRWCRKNPQFEIRDWHLHCRLKTLGDDAVNARSKTIVAAGWMPSHFIETGREYGQKITAADKSSTVKFCRFEECEFLKSVYNYNREMGLNVNIVGPVSYYKSFICYTKPSHGDMDVHWAELLSNALMEAAYGGPSSYAEIKHRAKEYWAATGMPEPEILSWNYEDWVEKYKCEPPQPKLGDKEDRGIELIRSYDQTPREKLAKKFSDLVPMKRGEDEAQILFEPNNDPPSFMTAEGETVDVTEEQNVLTQQNIPVEETSNPTPIAPTMQRMETARVTELGDVFFRRFLIHAEEFAMDLTPSVQQIRPYEALRNQRTINEKLGFFASMRAGYELEIEFTAPPTVTFSLMFVVLRFPDTQGVVDMLNPTSGLACSLSQKPHLFVNIGHGTGRYVLKVPYLHPAPCLPPHSQAWDEVSRILIYPLSTPVNSMDGSPVVHMKVYARYDDLKLTGATGISKASEPQVVESGEEEPNEQFSQKVMEFGELVSAVSAVPQLTALKVPGEMITEGGALLHYAGFSKPEKSLSMIPGLQQSFPNGNGDHIVQRLSVLGDQEVTPSAAVCGITDDELTFEKFGRRWSLIESINVPETASAETTLAWYNVTPNINLGLTGGGIQPASCAAPAHFFSYWNGTMEYKLVAVIPKMATGKLRWQYEPLNRFHESTDAYVDNSEESREHVVLDIGEQIESTLQVAYTSSLPALHCQPVTSLGATPGMKSIGATNEIVKSEDQLTSHWYNDNASNVLSHNGYIKLKLHSPFQTSSGSTMPVRLLIYARAGSDMQYFKYNGCLQGDLRVWKDFNPTPAAITAGKRISSVCVPTTDIVCESEAQTENPLFGAPPAETNAPTVTPMTVEPTAQTLAPTVVTLSPTTTQPTISPTEDLVNYPRRGSPGLVPGEEQPGMEMYWLNSTGVERAEASWKITEDVVLLMKDGPDGDQPGEVGVSCRLVSGTATINGVPVPNITDTLFFNQADNPEFWDGSSCTLDISGSAGFEIRIYSGTRRLPSSVGLSTTPPVNAGWTQILAQTGPDVVGYQSEEFRTLHNYPILVTGDMSSTVTYKGTIVARSAAGQTEYTSENAPGTWRRGEFPPNPIMDSLSPLYLSDQWEFKTVGSDSCIYSTTFQSTVNEVYPHPTSLTRRRLLDFMFTEGEDAIAQTDETTTFVVGSDASNPDMINRVLSGETVISFRVLLRQAQLINDFIVPAGTGHSEVTVLGDIYIDGDQDVISRTPYGFLVASFNGMRGGMLATYHIHGEGALVLRSHDAAIHDTGGVTGPGVAVCDSRVNPMITVKYPCQRNIDYTYTIVEKGPGTQKSLTISSWGTPIRVKEYRSIAEDFNLLDFRGCPALFIG